MSFRIGLVGLCTSHPESWVPIIRDLVAAKKFDAEITACWDSGETREAGFAQKFAQQFAIPHACNTLEEMLPLVDGVIVHTTNWDRHVEQARMFVEAGKAAYLDKPMAGNLADLNAIFDWQAAGKRVTGGSVLRYCPEVLQYLERPEEERGKVHTAYAAIGVDEFNYGIHGYAILSALFGTGLQSVRWIGFSGAHQIQLNWSEGRMALLSCGRSRWLPFNVTALTDRTVTQIAVDNTKIYRGMLEKVMPWFCGVPGAAAPLSGRELAEPELAAIAAKLSWQKGGAPVFLHELSLQDGVHYDGTEFAVEYRRARFAAK